MSFFPDIKLYISVEIGTTAATTLGLTAGTTVVTDNKMRFKNVEVFRSLQDVPDQNWSGNTYFTKNYADNFLTLADALVDGEFLKIKTL